MSFYHPRAVQRVVLVQPCFCYDTLFKAAWQTLRTLPLMTNGSALRQAPRWCSTLGANLSFTPTHTLYCTFMEGSRHRQWQTLNGRAAEASFPVKAMSKVFRAIYLRHFTDAYKQGSLHIPPRQKEAFCSMAPRTLCPALGCLCQSAFSCTFCCGGIPGTVHTQSTISNHRITNIDKQRVSFRHKDYRQDGKRKTMSLKELSSPPVLLCTYFRQDSGGCGTTAS